MYTVTFSFDLGDCVALYTGRIEAVTDNGYLVKYYEPTIRDLLSINLRTDEVISRGYSPVRMLPLAPVVQETLTQAIINSIVQPIYA
ncbi:MULTISPECIES: hypothetical protein [unclassified Spirosoma]|uniref:hypothetical protein n=1 Tax=unclassified Spirosoma TaxID=2621999 RepID=UPI00095C889E|nr:MULTISPECIES: hypothetical protein [unclassified Spirosoma]MBN8824466.1 hypothetical protein [Spirosoma sp.]OJW70070.1 MAG: hypothetical protein BGO59_25690 [Spirosoma sp. 48-14]